MAAALINGKSIAHKDIIFNVGGVQLVGLKNISASISRERVFNFGTSDEPVSYSDGRKNEGELSFELPMIEAEALSASATDNDPTKLPPFDIPVTMLGTSPSLWILKNVLVTGESVDSDVDTTDVPVAYTAKFSAIEKHNI